METSRTFLTALGKLKQKCKLTGQPNMYLKGSISNSTSKINAKIDASMLK